MPPPIPNPPPTATILHLSDLHLGKDTTDTGDSSRGTLISMLKQGGLKMQAHDPFILPSLSLNLRTAASRVHPSLRACDLNIVTGDISTNTSLQSRFDFAKEYLCGRVSFSSTLSEGLGLPTEKLFCIPGNHDKLNREDLADYNHAFGQLPAATPYRRSVNAGPGQQRFVIYGIDSNLYEEGNVALGRIYPETHQWLGTEFEKVRNENASAESAIRILILHHHPVDLNPFRRGSLIKYIRHTGRLTKLEDADRLLRLCRDNIDIILHGHEHFPAAFTDETSNCVVVSAGTVSQWQPKQKVPNSFHILSFHGLILKITQFDWDGGRFDPAQTWQCDLGVHPRKLASV